MKVTLALGTDLRRLSVTLALHVTSGCERGIGRLADGNEVRLRPHRLPVTMTLPVQEDAFLLRFIVTPVSALTTPEPGEKACIETLSRELP